jgi:enamine deaminase RidA (YjgF/YER057c/UK114 family)
MRQHFSAIFEAHTFQGARTVLRLDRVLSLAFVLTMGATAHAADQFPMKIPASGGEVILPDQAAKDAHDKYRYAAARRVGNTLYVSGVIVNRRDGEGRDVQAFKAQIRRAFERLNQILQASGVTFADVALINSFHIWTGPNFTGTRGEHFDAFEEVAGEFLKPPYPAWTAVGTTEVLSDGGIVEVQLIANVPAK